MIALRNKTVARTSLQWLDNADGRLYRERMLRSRNFATMVTLRHTSSLCTTEIKSQNLSKQTFILVMYLQFYFTPSFLYLHARQ